MGNYSGLIIDGALASREQSGFSVAGIGDVNGDGFDDIAVAAPALDVTLDVGGTPTDYDNAGGVYVIFGTDQGFDTSINTGDLDGTDGFLITPEAPLLNTSYGFSPVDFGVSVAGLGDVNGDGFDDFGIAQDYTATNAYAYFGELSPPGSQGDRGVVYVIFGGAGTTGAVENVADLGGFRVDAVGQVQNVFAAGDVNGDGFADVGLNTIERYVPDGNGGVQEGSVEVTIVDDQNNNGQYDPGEYTSLEVYNFPLGSTQGFVIFGTDQAISSDTTTIPSGTNGGAAATALSAGPSTTNTIVDTEQLDGSDGFEVVTGETASRPGYGYYGYYGYGYGGYGYGGGNYLYANFVQYGANGGELVALGDFNGDGFDDLLSTDIEASAIQPYFYRYDYNGYYTYQPYDPAYSVGQSTSGAFMVFGFDDSGLVSYPALIDNGFSDPNHDFRVSSLAIFDGDPIGGVGDVSGGDGRDDLAFEGMVPSSSPVTTATLIGTWVIDGTDEPPFSDNTFGAAANVRAFDENDALSQGAFYYDSSQVAVNGTQGFFANIVTGIGDVNGDDVDDFLIAGNPVTSFNEDVAYLVLGSAEPRRGLIDLATDENVYRIDDPSNQGFEDINSASGAWDFNADGRNDVLLGVPEESSFNGRTHAIFGGFAHLEILDAADGTDDNVLDTGFLSTVVAPGTATTGDDTVFGTSGDDTIDVMGGDDIYSGDAGDDSVRGNSGNDTLIGEAGDDTLIGGGNDDVLFGGADNDFINGQVGDDFANGGDGDDEVFGISGDDTLHGGEGNDKVVGGNDNDFLTGGLGMDTLNGGDGNDSALGGLDDDTLNGNDGNDTLDGGEGDDFISGGNDADILLGDDGLDFLTAGNGDDTANGGADNDTLIGGSGDDSLDGGDGDDRINGQTDNDTISGGEGDDSISGASGNDELSGDAGNDTLAAGAGNDTLLGGDDDDILSAGAGDDMLDGGTGSDTMDSSSGSDTLTGGADADTFIISHQGAASNGDVDTITDLDLSEDELIIRAFAGNAETVVTSEAQLYALGLPGLTIDDNGPDTTLTFDEGGGNIHSVILIGLDDPLTPF